MLILPAFAPAATAREIDLSGLDLDAALPVELPPLPIVAPATRVTAEWEIPGRVVIGFHGDVSATGPALSALASTFHGSIARVDATLGFAVVEVDPAVEELLLKTALANPSVSYAQRDGIARASFTPNDARYGEQWGPAAIEMPTAWDTTRGNASVMVAVIDTGVDATHADLAPNFCIVGPDYPNGDSNASDDHGHGTHVAGTIAARIDNGVGVAGMADACLMSVKVLDGGGSGSWTDVASGIVWAVDNGADILSLSLGGCAGCDPGAPLSDAVTYAETNGVLLVAAAGNAYCAPVGYPAAYPTALAVAALDTNSSIASFSSCGPEVDVAAPGAGILSTSLTSGPLSDPSGYMYLDGTSMATPHVSGVAALLLAQNATLSPADLRCILAQTADDILAAGHDDASGWGRIDAAAALGATCAPSVPNAPQLDALAGGSSVSLQWTSVGLPGSDATEFRLYRGLDNASLALHSIYPGGARSALDTDVVNGQSYVYRISGANGVGEGLLSNEASATPLTPLALPATFDLEGSVESWNVDGLWHVTEDRSASLTHAFYYGMENGAGLEDNTYDTGMANRGTLTSPPIALDAASASLSFWHFFEGEGGNWEHPIVQVSAEGPFGPWTTVHENNATSGNGTVDVDLAPFVGSTIQIRFLWDTIDGGVNAYEGWYVDDVAVTTGDVTLPCDGSADSFGYTCAEATFDLTDITSFGTPLIMGDDQLSAPIPMGFPLTFYGVTREEAIVSTNGFVTFSTDADNTGCCSGREIPDPTEPDEFVAGFWTDLLPASGNGTIHYATIGDAPSRVFLVQYTNVELYGRPGATNTFQVKVFENGTIETHLATVSTADTDRTATIGIEDCNGEIGLQAAYGLFSAASLAFRFTPPLVPGPACVPPIPNDPPVVVIDTPAYDEILIGVVNVNGTASDPDPLDAVEGVSLTLSPTSGGAGGSFTANGTTSWSYALDTTQFVDGQYVLTAWAHDGEEFGSTAILVHLQNGNTNTPPSVAFTSPADGSTVVGLVTVTGIGSDAEDGSPSDLQIWINGGQVPWVGNTSAWSFDLDTTQYGDGVLTIDAVAYDPNGASGTASLTLNVQNGGGNTPPVASFTSPYDGATLSGVTIVSGNVMDAEGDPIADVAVVLDGLHVWYLGGSDPWSVAIDTAAYGNGPHTFEVWANDGTNWWFGDSVSVTFDNGGSNQQPTVGIVTPCAGCSVLGDLYASGTATDPEGDAIVGVYFAIDSGSFGLANGTSSWWATADTSQLSIGWHTLYVYAVDGVSMQPSALAVVQFYVESPPNTAPTIEITAPIWGALVDGRTLIEGIASDADEGDAIVLVQARVDDGAWLDVGGGDEWAFYWDTEATYDGWHTIEARAYDGDLLSDVASVTVEVENPHAPTVSISWPCCGAILGGVIQVGGYVNDADGDAAIVELRLDGGAWLPTTISSSYNNSAYWTRYVDTRDLVDGMHDLEARAFDGTAYSAIVLAQVYVLNTKPTPPALAIDAPAWDETVSGAIEIRGRAFDPEGDVTRVEVQVDNGMWRTAFGTNDWSLALDTRAMSDGWHSVAARAVDDEGTSTFEYTYFIVDNRPDLTVEAVRVEDGALQTDLGDAPFPVGARDVVVTYANLGARAARNVTLEITAQVEVASGVYSQELICSVKLGEIAAGASLERACRWDPVGTVGDVVFVARIDVDHNVWETNEQNNAKSARNYVGVGGIGRGLMLPPA